MELSLPFLHNQGEFLLPSYTRDQNMGRTNGEGEKLSMITL